MVAILDEGGTVRYISEMLASIQVWCQKIKISDGCHVMSFNSGYTSTNDIELYAGIIIYKCLFYNNIRINKIN